MDEDTLTKLKPGPDMVEGLKDHIQHTMPELALDVPDIAAADQSPELVIEQLQPVHAARIRDMAKTYYSEATPWQRMPLNIPWMEDFFRQSTSDTSLLFYVLVHVPSRKVVGMAFARVGTTFFSPEPVCHDLTVYVMPQYRKRGWGVRMLKRLKEDLSHNKVKRIIWADTTGIDVGIHTKIAERLLGLKPVGNIYM